MSLSKWLTRNGTDLASDSGKVFGDFRPKTTGREVSAPARERNDGTAISTENLKALLSGSPRAAAARAAGDKQPSKATYLD